MNRDWPSGDAEIAAVKRAAYLIGLPLGALAALLLLGLEHAQGTLHIVDRIGLPLLALLATVLSVFFWRRWGRFFVLELALFSGFSLMLLASLTYSIMMLASTDVTNLTGLGYWTTVLFPLAFLIFGVRTGLRISLGVYVLSLGVWITEFLIGSNGSAAERTTLFQMYTANGLQLLLLYAFGVLVQVQARQGAEHEHDANTDPLTRLYNRRFLHTQLAQEFERAERYGRTFSVALLDLDHFKNINDHCGHLAGDETLQGIAQLLRDHTRTLDVAGRWGGEEFLLLLPELPLAAATEVAERFRLRLEAHAFGHNCPMTASFGVAEVSPGETLESLLTRTDRALYAAKAQGRNCVVPASEGASVH